MSIFIKFIIFILACLKQANSYPYFPECLSYNKNSTILNTLNGDIKGACYTVAVNHASKPNNTYQVLTWLSIPYAEAPIDKLRFKKPVPIKSWTEPLDGTQWPNKCIQIDNLGKMSAKIAYKQGKMDSYSEDCLYLNVFVPYNVYLKSIVEKDSKFNAPVLLWIHGGAFLIGSSTDDRIEPSTLVAMSNIIVVTINYRLGAFGFLHIKNTDASGNQGILDQSLAIKWVHENAHRFGGDKSRITIAGQSAGSWSVGYHLMYKPSWPYFRNAILESGTPLQTTFKLITSDEATSRAFMFGQSVGCVTNETKLNNQELFECFQSTSKGVISAATLFGFVSMYNYSELAYQKYVSLFPLVIDGIEFKETAKCAFETGNFKKTNILTGVTTKETANLVILSSYFGSNFLEYESKANLNYTFFRFLLEDFYKFYPNQDDTFIDKIINLYVPYFQILDETTNFYSYFIQITTDQMFRCPTVHLAEIYSKYNMNAYVYLYGYRISTTPYPRVYGTVHSDELAMTFAEPLSVKTPPLLNFNPWSATEHNYTVEERLISENIVKYWTNFVINSNPNDAYKCEWNRYKAKNYFYSNLFNGLFDDKNRNIIYFSGKNSNINYRFSEDQACRFWQK